LGPSPPSSDEPGLEKSRPTSSTLLERVKALEPDAWRRLAHLYGCLIFRWCRQAQVPAKDSADVVQEVFRSVFVGMATFRRDRPGDTFRGWLRIITRNELHDYWRRHGLQPRAIGGDTAYGQLQQVPESATDGDVVEEHLLLTQRLMRLVRDEFECRTWEAFWRTTVAEEDTAAVAADLGMTSSAVRQAKCRVLRRLRGEIEELGS
jgi:RNA polymerase sigma-70 factor, ECF subfamily